MDFKTEIIYNEFAPLFEAIRGIRIVKRARDQGKDDREMHKATAHAKEIDTGEDDLFVANIDGILVVKSRHMKEVRDGQSHPRDYYMDNEYITKVIKKLIKKPNFKPGKTMVAFRNKKGKYDLLAINYDQRFRTIKIITFIKKDRRKGWDAFSTNKDYDKNPKMVVEALKSLGITEEIATELSEFNEFILVD